VLDRIVIIIIIIIVIVVVTIIILSYHYYYYNIFITYYYTDDYGDLRTTNGLFPPTLYGGYQLWSDYGSIQSRNTIILLLFSENSYLPRYRPYVIRMTLYYYYNYCYANIRHYNYYCDRCVLYPLKLKARALI